LDTLHHWGSMRTDNSARCMNVYRKGRNTPLDVDRYAYGTKITLYVNRWVRRDTWYTVKVTTGVNVGTNNLEARET
jgi:hypothetical protein